MKKIDIWLIAAFALTFFVNPDTTNVGIASLVYANLIMAVICKASSVAKNDKDNEDHGTPAT